MRVRDDNYYLRAQDQGGDLREASAYIYGFSCAELFCPTAKTSGCGIDAKREMPAPRVLR